MKIIKKVKNPQNIHEIVEFMFEMIRHHRNLGKYHRGWINYYRKGYEKDAKEREIIHTKRFDHHAGILMMWNRVLPKYTAKL